MRKLNLDFFKLVIFLSLIFVLSAYLRLYKLGQVPNGLTVDEADMGYNAYSILKTNKDVYGKTLPYFFQSLDDYKPGFAIYSSIPAIKIFGLTDFSIRLFPALIGSLTPITIFFLARLLYKNNKYFPAAAAIIAAVSPWNVQISRATLMYIDLIFFLILAFIAFLLALRINKMFLPISAILFSTTLYIYYSTVVYIPLIFFGLVVIYYKNLLNLKKICLLSMVIFAIFSLPAIYNYSNPASRSRLNAISVFTPDISLPISIKETEKDSTLKNPFLSWFHNRRLVYASNILDNYFDYFNLDYLFVNSHNVRYFYVNYIGLFYLVELPFFIIGLILLLTRREKSDLLLLGFLVIGPLPASITLGSPFPHRGIILLLAIEIITALGFAYFLSSVRFLFKKQLILLIFATFLLSVVYFFHQYFFHSPQEFSTEDDNGAWFSTVKKVIPQVNIEQSKYNKVVFTWSKGKVVPPVYFLFYNKTDPATLQAKANLWQKDPPSYKQLYNQIGNIEFRPIEWQNDKKLKDSLVVGYPSDFSTGPNKYTNSSLTENYFVFVKTEWLISRISK